MKKRLVVAVILCVCMFFGTLQGNAASANEGEKKSGMFMGNLQHTGVKNTTGLEQLKGLKWRFKTEGKIYASPVVVGKVAYVGSEDKNFYAVDVYTGFEKWRFKTGGGIDSTCAIENDTAYFASKDGYFYAVNINNGALRWKFKTRGEKMKDIWDYYLSSPAVYEGIVYFGSGDKYIYALNAETGKRVWSFKTEGIVHTSPMIANDMVYMGSYDGYFYALDTLTGKLNWKFKTLGNYNIVPGIQGSASYSDGLIYFGCRDYNMYVLDAETGNVYWNYTTPSWLIGTPAVKDSMLYYGNSDFPSFFAYDMNLGEIKWQFPVSLNIFGGCTIAGETGYFGSLNGKLYAVDLAAGKIKWCYQTESSKQNYNTVVNENDKFKMELWDTLKGNVIYDMIQSLGSIMSTPDVQDGVVYFGSTDGYLYALF